MRPRRLRPALLAALAVLLLAVGLAPTQASVAGASDDATGGETVATVLHPGWNMVGWVGPPTPTAELFDALPQLQRVSAWDAGEGGYLRAFRDSYSQLASLTPGMGLWLHIGGDAVVEWSRPVRPHGFEVRLETGYNIVAIAADGGVTSLDLVAAGVWRWNAVEQRFDAYGFGDESLRAGDALLLEAPSATTWWQPGTPDQALVFVGDVPADTQATILTEYKRVKSFFATRFGVVTPGPLQYVGPDTDALRDIYASAFGFPLSGEICVRGTYPVYLRVTGCSYPHMNRSMIGTFLGYVLIGSWNLGADWLQEGIRLYALTTYLEGQERLTDSVQGRFIGEARRTVLPLRHFEVSAARDGTVARSAHESALSFLAAELLGELAGRPALFEYVIALRGLTPWKDAFEGAFGRSVEEFYEEFAARRAQAFPPHPHLTDGLDKPALVVLDGVPANMSDLVRQAFADVQAFVEERFGASASEFTLYIAPDAGTALATVPDWLVQSTCHVRMYHGRAVIILDQCVTFPDVLHTYFFSVRDELAYEQPTPFTGSDARGPAWFELGAELYARARYTERTGTGDYSSYREAAARSAAGARQRLERLVTPGDEDWGTVGWLGFLAVEWLAKYAGDPAVFEYYRVLPSSTSREAAFKHAFGLTVDDFYERFEAYRAELGTP